MFVFGYLFEAVTIFQPAQQYLDAPERVKAFGVVNDSAERAVKLVSDYNNRITIDPDQENYLL